MKPFRLSRRTFLRGLGATVALPWLEAMIPHGARAASQGPPRRLITYYMPCGIVMANWRPVGEGADYTLSPILQPLAPFKDRLLVLSGLENYAGAPQGDGAGDHARGTGCFATATHVNKSGEELINGISVDQMAAQNMAPETLFRSLELGIDPGGATGVCDSGYSCAYSYNTSWSGPHTPVAKEIEPAQLFARLFGGGPGSYSAEEVERRRRYKLSVLDTVGAQATSLQSRMGHSDRQKMEEYLTGIRELEVRIQRAGEAQRVCEPGLAPEQTFDVRERIRQMSDLMVLAFQCDLTRVISFMLANGGSNRIFPWLGFPEAHHYLSHHQGNEEYLAKLTLIDTWEMEMLAYLMARLDTVSEGEGTLLDYTGIFVSSEISDGDAHNHNDMPVLLAGGLGGAVTSGRHVVYGGKPPIANLFISLLEAMGVSAPRFGDDGTGPLSGLTV